MITSAAAIATVLGLLAGLLWCTKRLNAPATKTNTLKLIDTLAIGPGRSIAIIRSGEKHFLLGTTAQAITLIAELPYEHSNPENLKALKASR